WLASSESPPPHAVAPDGRVDLSVHFFLGTPGAVQPPAPTPADLQPPGPTLDDLQPTPGPPDDLQPPLTRGAQPSLSERQLQVLRNSGAELILSGANYSRVLIDRSIAPRLGVEDPVKWVEEPPPQPVQHNDV